MELDEYAKNIKSTGFILENKISELLSEHKWNVINNKYYIDDVEKVAREIDIIAYKATKVKDVQIYTSLIISCKKNEEKVWALLSKELNKNDPNMDFEPLQNWTNHPIIKYEMDIANTDKSALPDGDLYDDLFKQDNHIFAFQEMYKGNGKPHNDKNIFNSITSLMKSQSYELASLPNRKTNRTIYFFYLVSVIDSKIILLKCSGDDVQAEEINTEVYISNYIIEGKSVSSKIKFATVIGFMNLIDSYNKLHTHNISFIEGRFTAFYKDVITNKAKREILIKELMIKYGREMRPLLYKNLKVFKDLKVMDVYESKGKIVVDIDSDDMGFIDKLNESEDVKNEISRMITDVFKIRINDNLEFSWDIPF
ncbi:hypothetical protein ACQJ2V_04310 [Klebsiella variicola subsp. variicola]|uniref:hypothetical protein n=1 Tax=Klebsiella variicola TaxID=244366 RepID=UPI003D043F4A